MCTDEHGVIRVLAQDKSKGMKQGIWTWESQTWEHAAGWCRLRGRCSTWTGRSSRGLRPWPSPLLFLQLLREEVIRTVGFSSRHERIASGEIDRVLGFSLLSFPLCFYAGRWRWRGTGLPVVSRGVVRCGCGGGFRSTPEPAVCVAGGVPSVRPWAKNLTSGGPFSTVFFDRVWAH